MKSVNCVSLGNYNTSLLLTNDYGIGFFCECDKIFVSVTEKGFCVERICSDFVVQMSEMSVSCHLVVMSCVILQAKIMALFILHIVLVRSSLIILTDFN